MSGRAWADAGGEEGGGERRDHHEGAAGTGPRTPEGHLSAPHEDDNGSSAVRVQPGAPDRPVRVRPRAVDSRP
ncbi:hypothetical protein GCM10027261_36060 [Geodermatophilus arenarius]